MSSRYKSKSCHYSFRIRNMIMVYIKPISGGHVSPKIPNLLYQSIVMLVVPVFLWHACRHL